MKRAGEERAKWRPYRVAVLVLLGWLCPLVAGAAAPLRVELLAQSARARTAAPIPVLVRLTWDSARLLEGRLEMEFRCGGRVVARYRSGEMALTAGEQQVRLLLPALPDVDESEVQVGLCFAGERERLALPPCVLHVPSGQERSLVVAVCSPRETASPRLHPLEQSLRLERFLPVAERPSLQRPLVTSVARLTPEMLPANPLAYCAYDIVVLDAGALGGLGERQREALRRWVEGGGSLCVFAGERLTAEPCDFLNALAADTQRFALGPEGRLADDGIVRLRPGIGRCVVVARAFDFESEPPAAAWRDEVGFLWKLRVNAAAALARDGRLDPVALADEAETATYFPASMANVQRQLGAGMPPRGNLGSSYTYGVQGQVGGAVTQALMPKTVRLIPLRALFGILVLFVLLIGPVDWWVLGRLKCRRYTWVLFPCVTAAVTAATILTANHYLGRGDLRRALTVVDVGAGGKVLRQDRYELSFAGRDRRLAVEQRQALWSVLGQNALRDAYSGDPYSYYARTPRAGDSAEETEVTEFAGAVPLRYEVGFGLRQWRPRMTRSLSFEGTAPPVHVSWAEVDAALQTCRMDELIGAFQRGVGASVDVAVFRGGSRVALPLLDRWVSERILVGLSAPTPPRGLFALAAQVSPTGGGNLEDLLCVDASDPDEWLVLATVQSGDDIVIYRYRRLLPCPVTR